MELKKYWRLYLELALVAALLIVSGLYYSGKGKSQVITKKSQAKTALHNPVVQPIKTYKDTAGDQHLQILANTGQIPQDILKDTSVTNNTSLDTSARALKIKDDQILELTKENLQLKAALFLKPVINDPYNTLFQYSDNHLSLLYDTKTNQANVDYHVNIITGKFTPASILPFISRPAVLDFSTDDPRATIDNVQHMSTLIPAPRVGFAADLKALYDLDSHKIFPSAGANLRLGRWHLEDRFYYDQKVKQAASVSIDVFKF